MLVSNENLRVSWADDNFDLTNSLNQLVNTCDQKPNLSQAARDGMSHTSKKRTSSFETSSSWTQVASTNNK